MRVLAGLSLVWALSSVACGPTVDLTKALKITVVDSGWYDAGIVNGENKLVPFLSFTLTNTSAQKLVTLQVSAQFRRANEETEWGSAFLTAAGSSGLAPGATTETLTVRSQHGYTGRDQSRQEMMQNSHFVDASVQLFAKYSSIQWVKVGVYPIQRKLVTK